MYIIFILFGGKPQSEIHRPLVMKNWLTPRHHGKVLIQVNNRHVPLVIRIVSSKKTGYIQNMFHRLNIKNLQYKFVIFFLLQLGGLVGWVETPIGKFQLDFIFYL